MCCSIVQQQGSISFPSSPTAFLVRFCFSLHWRCVFGQVISGARGVEIFSSFFRWETWLYPPTQVKRTSRRKKKKNLLGETTIKGRRKKKKLSRVTLHVYVLWDRLPIRPLYSIKPTFFFSFHQPEILRFFCIRFFRKKAVDTGFSFLLIRPSVRSGLSRRVLVVLGEASCNSSSSSNLFERKCMSSSRWQLSHRGECSFVGFALRE